MRARWLISLLMFALAFPALAQDRRGGSLDRVLPSVRQSVPGTFYDAEGPFFGADGQASYRLKWMTPDGRIIWFSVDAQNGRVLGGVPSGTGRGRYRDSDERPRNNWQDNGGWGTRDGSRGGWGDRDGRADGGWSSRGGRDEDGWGDRSGTMGSRGDRNKGGNPGNWGDRNNQGGDRWGDRGWGGNRSRDPGNWGNRGNQDGDRGGGWGGRSRSPGDWGDRGNKGGWGGRNGNNGGSVNDERGGRHRSGE